MAKNQDPEEAKTPAQGNINKEYNVARLGLDMDSSATQVKKGVVTYALNAVVENFDANSVNYQNEPGNVFCLSFPEGFKLIGDHFINEKKKHIFFLVNPKTGDCQIGYMDNNDCVYRTLVSSPCLGFNEKYPIHKIVHKITNCTTEIYWPDNVARRWLDIDNIPYKLISGSPLCDPIYSNELDCNQLKIQPNFAIPGLKVKDVITGGDLITGTYQFAIQYSDAAGAPLTAYYSVTNPCPIFDPAKVTVNFNTPVGKSIVINIDNLEATGIFDYFNLAVIKTINDITSAELVGTFSITGDTKDVTYTGQNKIATQISLIEIFEKFPYYDLADDITTSNDILIWKGLTTIDRINYQSIASKIKLLWETYKIPASEGYKEETNAANYRSYMRDEIYAIEIVFLLTNGRQTDGFHIPGRVTGASEMYPPVPDTSEDFVGTPTYYDGTVGYSPYWKIYNTATVIGTDPNYSESPKYKGPYQYGLFGYWESEEEYPCNSDLWGELAGQKIRHHKFPDVLISPITQSTMFMPGGTLVMEDTAIFPIGIKLDLAQIQTLIAESNLTDSQKEEIIGFKIIRGNRGTNRSIVAKGILRNVNKYERDAEEFYYPNYPYNDLRKDPFLNITNNAWSKECESFTVNITELWKDPEGIPYAEVKIIDCNTNKDRTIKYTTLKSESQCSLGKPTITTGKGTVAYNSYDQYVARVGFSDIGFRCAGYRVEWNDYILGRSEKWVSGDDTFDMRVPLGASKPKCIENCGGCDDKVHIDFVTSVTTDSNCQDETSLPGIESNQELGYRQVFNSPETSFAQPFLGNILKLENVIFGAGKAHFVEVKDNAKYRLLTLEAQQDAFASSESIACITEDCNATALFAAYQTYIDIYIKGITRKNYALSYNSIASYNYNLPIANGLGIKQRNLEISRYLIPVVQSVGEERPINNFNRETSVFLKTQEEYENDFVTIPKTGLPFPKDSQSMLLTGVEDKSRYTLSEKGLCGAITKETDISVVSYYASIKNQVNNQWGQIYSYATVDTGFQINMSAPKTTYTVFGGDTFINKFAFKTKLPFFIDNRVNAPDDSDIFYDELGNIAYPKYWHSARSILSDASFSGTGILSNFYSYKAHEFDCKNSQEPGPPTANPNRTFYDGYFYMFAYGIPSFYCESSYNVDLRQAFNNKEGEFWPHVSTSIPDDWLQETNVTILQDNTYYYNVSFSKQNKENNFTNLPPDWSDKLCYTQFPFRAVYSDVQITDQDNRVNNWLIYRPVSYFDFPQNYGKLVSIDGIENSGVLVRYENKLYLYNKLLTIDTSNPQAVYIGNNKLFANSPPVDFADTDLGYLGTQNKFILKVPSGQVVIDAKRGQVFMIQGNKIEVLSKLSSGMNSFLKEHLPYKILDYFPEKKIKVNDETITVPGIDIDNNYTGVGLHGVYDNRYDRIIFTKLDYVPLSKDIKLNPYTQEFYIETIENNKASKKIVELEDPLYFCNKSFTLSYNFNTASWISFHSYLPDYYIADNNFFYSGNQMCCADFDFIVGTLVDNPTTTTTTTIYVPECSPLIGTAVAIVDTCTPLVGQVVITDCGLTGTGTVTVPPVCQRPSGLTYFSFTIGYEDTPDPYVDFTVSLATACAGITYMHALSDPTIDVSYLSGLALALTVGNYIYDTTGTDCTYIPDGFYFTEESSYSNIIYEVVNGQIVAFRSCVVPTTTTTTTATPLCTDYNAVSSWTPVTLEWLDCGGTYHIYTSPGGSAVNTFNFCATTILNSAGYTIIALGPC